MPSPPDGGGTPVADQPALHRVTLHRVALPLRRPFVAAHGTEDDRQVVLVEVEDAAGGYGWGECPALRHPTYTSETVDTAWVTLTGHLVPAALAGVPHHAADPTAPMASGGLADALLDLAVRRRGLSVAAHLGGVRSVVPSGAVVGLVEDLDELVGEVADRVAAGHRQVKLKVTPGHDLAPLRAVRRTWPDLPLAADANGSYPHAGAVPVDELLDLGLGYLEQPLPSDDWDGVGVLATQGLALALDEAIAGPADLDRAVRAGAAWVNAKPARLGGLERAAALVGRAQQAGVGVFVGGMLESGVGRAVALALASLPGCVGVSDLGPSANYVAEDLTEPFVLTEGCLTVPRGPGLGVVPIAAVLAERTVDRWTLAR